MPKGKMKETPEDQAVTKKALENSGPRYSPLSKASKISKSA
ncbi:MAG: hypothetical protein U1E58_10265 [Tabrizicola sp.]